MMRSKYLIISLILGISMVLPQGSTVHGEEIEENQIIIDDQALLPMEPELSPEPEQPPESELPPELEPIAEPEYIVPEPVIIYRNLGLYAEAEPIEECWTNGDVLRYEVHLSNDGTETLSNVEVQDDLGLSDNIGSLKPGESITLYGAYRIDEYNRDEIIGNWIDIKADFEGEHISLNIGFSVDIKIPKGSITIINNSVELEGRNEGFDFIIDGPMGSSYSMSLMPGESGTLEGLFIGDYRIFTIAPMYYKASSGSDLVELTLEDLDGKVQIERSKLTEAWFSSSRTGVVSGNIISSNDIETEVNSYSYFNNRSDSAFIELEPIIIIPEPIMIIPEIIIPVESPPVTEEPIAEEPIIEETIIGSEAVSVDPEESCFSPATTKTDPPEELDVLDAPIESEVSL